MQPRARRRRMSFEHLFHQVNAPARSVQLLAEKLVSRTCRVAKAAVYAGAQNGVRFPAGLGIADEGCEGSLHRRATACEVYRKTRSARRYANCARTANLYTIRLGEGSARYADSPAAPVHALSAAPRDVTMDLATAALYFFDPNSDGERQRRTARRLDEAVRPEARLFCAHCKHAITDDKQRAAVNGAHAHTCTNPHGITFHIGCFRQAPGCTAEGAATAEHTWFPGYAWQIAYCARCDTHLGWLFTSPDDAFYGLITGRLISASPAA